MPNLYVKRLIDERIVSAEEVTAIANDHIGHLNKELAEVDRFQPAAAYYERQWAGLGQAGAQVTTWDTGLPYDLLRHVGEQSVRVPEGFVSIYNLCLLHNWIFYPHLYADGASASAQDARDGSAEASERGWPH